MKLATVRERAFAMPLNDPAYPRGPYKFYNREFVVITYRTDIDILREVVPEPLEPAGDTVGYEFIRMPDSTGFGDYTQTGQVIPILRSLEAGRFGAFRRSWQRRKFRTRAKLWSAPYTTVRSCASPPRWVTSIASSIPRRC